LPAVQQDQRGEAVDDGVMRKRPARLGDDGKRLIQLAEIAIRRSQADHRDPLIGRFQAEGQGLPVIGNSLAFPACLVMAQR